MDTLSLLFGVVVGSFSSYVGIWLKIKFGERLSLFYDLLKSSKEIFDNSTKTPSMMDFEVIESVVKKKDENTHSNNTDKPKNNEPSKEVKDKV